MHAGSVRTATIVISCGSALPCLGRMCRNRVARAYRTTPFVANNMSTCHRQAAVLAEALPAHSPFGSLAALDSPAEAHSYTHSQYPVYCRCVTIGVGPLSR